MFDKPVYVCDWCDTEQYTDVYYDLDGANVCPECIEDRKHIFDRDDGSDAAYDQYREERDLAGQV